MNTVSATFKLPTTLQKKLLHQVVEDGYGMRGKSRWITEAVEQFLSLADFPTLVDIAGDIHDLTHTTSIRLPEQLANQIEQAVLKVRQKFPSAEGVKSNIIRASILQRLLRSQ